MDTSEKGMSIIKSLLLLIVVGILGATLWYVFHSKHNTEVSLSAANRAISIKPKSTPAVKNLAWKSLPSDLQKTILASWVADAPGCLTEVKGPETVDDKVYYVLSNQFATAPVGCDSSSLHLITKVDGAWQDVERSQGGFTCATITKYNVPKIILTAVTGDVAECIQDDGTSKRL